MKNGGVSRFAKVVALILLSVWSLLILDLTGANPEQWLVISLTALIFAIVGRMWRIEATYWLDQFGPIQIDFGGDENE